MPETATPVRVLYPDEGRPIIRECGSNPPPADGNAVQHIDQARSVFSRAIQQLWPAAAPTKPAPTPPRIPPQEELAALEKQLVFLQGQLTAVRAILDAAPDTEVSTSATSVTAVEKRYRSLLTAGVDLANAPLVDAKLLLGLLRTVDGGGMVDVCQSRVNRLREQLQPEEAPTDEHRALIRAATKTMKAWAKAYASLREYEANTPGKRHQFRCPRATFGLTFGQVDERTLKSVAEFAASLPEAVK